MKNIVVLGCCRSGHNFIREQIKSWCDNETLLYNFEDVRPIDYERQAKGMVCEGNLLNSKLKTINIIVVRDLLNWWASYLKWITKDGIDNYLVEEKKLQNAFDIWLSIIKETYNLTNYIKNSIHINYDAFNAFIRYRRVICNIVGGTYNENAIDLVVSAGGGSSFDGQKIAGSKMKTASRYKQILKGNLNDLYLKMLRKNKESIDLYEEFFDITEDQKAVLKVI